MNPCSTEASPGATLYEGGPSELERRSILSPHSPPPPPPCRRRRLSPRGPASPGSESASGGSTILPLPAPSEGNCAAVSLRGTDSARVGDILRPTSPHSPPPPPLTKGGPRRRHQCPPGTQASQTASNGSMMVPLVAHLPQPTLNKGPPATAAALDWETESGSIGNTLLRNLPRSPPPPPPPPPPPLRRGAPRSWGG